MFPGKLFLGKLFFGMMFLISVQDTDIGNKDIRAKLDDCIWRIGNGDMDALEMLYEETRTAVYGFAFSIMKDVHDADDVTQDVYIQVVRSANEYVSSGKPMAWLLTITKNLARMQLRQKKWIAGADSEDAFLARVKKAGAESSDIFVDRPDVTAEDRVVLRDLLSRLSQEERDIVVLHAVSGMKHREIAEMLDMPLSTVLSKYRRAIKKLQKEWG